MPRLRIIVLDQPDGNPNSYNVAFWADVPAARQGYYASTGAGSQWKDALPADIAALQNGSVVEHVRPHQMPSGTTLAQIEAYLQNQWQNYQNAVTNFNSWVHYGSTWDGTTWTITTGG
jgi:hypothetical protein